MLYATVEASTDTKPAADLTRDAASPTANTPVNASAAAAADQAAIDQAEADRLEALAQARMDALNRIKAAEDAYLISKMTAKDQEILAVQDKYQQLIQLAIESGESTRLLEEAQAQAFFEIDEKYAAKEKELKDKQAEEDQKR